MKKKTSTKAAAANPQLAAAIFEALPFIDEALDAEGREVSARPMAATNLFVEYYILDIKGATKEKAYHQDWFAVMFAIVTNWYEAKYGEALHTKTDLLFGVVQIHGLPFSVRVPPTYAKPHSSGEASDLCFGPALGADEAPRKWINSPPNLNNLSPEEAKALDKDLSELTRRLRRTNLNFMFADPAPVMFNQFRSIAKGSIKIAAQRLVSGQEGDYASAVWDSYFALENGVKALIAQRGETPSFDHDLTSLLKEAQAAGSHLALTHDMGFLPGKKQAIAHRYGAPVPNGYKGALAIYTGASVVLEEISSFVSSKFKFGDDVVFTLAKPNWFKFMDDE